MVIIYGHRAYGRVDERGGEWAQTQFAHVYFLPLFPTGSTWMLGDDRGLRIGLHGKSVAAAYLRIWAPLIGFGCMLASPGLVTLGVLLATVALSAWSWTWRSVRLDHARRRSDFNAAALGTRCEPRRLPPETRDAIRTGLEQRRARFADPRPPEDVARFGPRHRDEAMIAYGLLRIAEVDHNSHDAGEAAERLLHSNHDELPAGEGPYREPGQAAPDELLPEVFAASASDAPVAPPPRAASRGNAAALRWVLTLACFGVGALGLSHVGKAFGPTPIDASTKLDAHTQMDFVSFTCDSAIELGTWQPAYSDDTYRVFGCALGDRTLLALTDLRVHDLPKPVEGELSPLSATAEADLPADLRTDPSFSHLKLIAGDQESHIAWSIFGLLSTTGGIGVALWWLRGRRRARAAAAQAG